jgi:hypothetical protein
MFTIIEQKKGEVEQVMAQFQHQLSEKEIKSGVAAAINDTLRRVISGKLNKGLKEKYNIRPTKKSKDKDKKSASRIATVSPRAGREHLVAGIKITTERMPLMAFNPKQQGSSISVSIRKGKTVLVRNAFIATMKSGHTGVFARGEYQPSSFKYYTNQELRKGGIGRTERDKRRITELVSISVHAMAVSRSVAPDVKQFMGTYVLDRVNGILRSKVQKLGNS